MPDPRWERIRELVEAALDLAPGDRPAFLDASCGGDAALRAEVEDLLRHASEAPTDFVAPPSDLSTTAPPAGMQLGEFTLVEELGRGGMGVVYRARQASLQRDVAVKVLVRNLATGTSDLERFHREARAAAKLDHPHITQIYQDGVAGDVHWYAMELVAGHSLQRELQLQRSAEPGSDVLLPLRNRPGHIAAVAGLVADVAEALAHAHQHGVVHRDVKPANLLLDRTGRVKIVDFGIARDQSLGALTHSDQVLGSVHYMSPEQARQITVSVDHRTDVYSLGVVLYELLTSEPPYQGSTRDEVIRKIRVGEPRPVRTRNRTVPRDLATICGVAMSKQPGDRYPSAGALADDLRRFLAHESIQAQPPHLLRRVARFARRHRVALTVTATAAVAWSIGLTVARRAARDATRELALVELRDLPAHEALDRLPTDRLMGVRRTIARLNADPELDTAGRTVVSTTEAALQVMHRRRRVAAQSRLEVGLRVTAGGGDGYAEVLAAVQELQRLAVLFPEDPSAVGTDALAPRVSITARTARGRAAGVAQYRLLDPVTGQPGPVQSLGPLPVHEARLPLGHLRLGIRVEGFGLREFSRVLSPAARLGLDLVLRGETRDITGMRRIGAGTLRLRDPEPDSRLDPLNARVLPVEEFWLDECEVSNAAYRQFLAAEPARRAPPYWPRIRPGSREDSLPVTGISWLDAQAFAEWVGKRLPSHAEWMFAARGTAAALLPWPDAVAGQYRGNTRGERIAYSAPRSAKVALYLRSAAPVRSHPDARTGDGIYHLLGNVAEWTETHLAERVGESFVPNYQNRIFAGGSWNVGTLGQDLRGFGQFGIGANYAWVEIGFRCARSIPRP
ncbi:MAG: protein kinase [Planctomycetes bacterium]|nr:protein kinase [Planctomycetota bacterium]